MKTVLTALALLFGSGLAATLEDAQKLLSANQYTQAAQTAWGLNTEAGDLLAADALITGYWKLPVNQRDDAMADAEKYAARALKRRETAEAHFLLGSAIGYAIAVKGISGATRVQEVREQYERALVLDPNHSEANFGLGQWHLNVPPFLGGKLSEAERLFAKAVEISPKRVSYRLAYADALMKISARNKRRAIAQLEEGLRIVPLNDDMKAIQDQIRKKLEGLRG